jgi:hypothetical protein
MQPTAQITDYSAHRRRVWHWLIPSIPQLLWLLLLLLLLTKPWRTIMVSADGDACMHSRVGEYMLQTGHIIRADVFSHTRFGKPIISKEWLSEIIFAIAGRIGGLFGLSVVAAMVIATTFAFLYHRLLREGSDPLVSILIVMLAIWAASGHWLARPHVFSFLLALLWNDALRRYDRGGRAVVLTIILPVLTLLWVNLHGAFLAGMLIWAAYWGGAVLERFRSRNTPTEAAELRRKIRILSLVGLLITVVSLLNPNGYELHVHNIRFLKSSFFVGWLAEYQSTDFQSSNSQRFLAWLGLMFFTLVWVRPRLSPASAILIIMWTYFALYSARNIPLLTIITAPIFACVITDWLRDTSHSLAVAWRNLSAGLDQMQRAARGWPVTVAAAVVAIIVPAHPTEMLRDKWPVDSVAFVRQHPEQFVGYVFNQYAWGGYLLEYLPEHKVFVDGRTDFYGADLVKEFDETTALRTNWLDVLARYDVRWTLMPTDHPLNIALALLPQWRRVYSDEVATVFSKTE